MPRFAGSVAGPCYVPRPSLLLGAALDVCALSERGLVRRVPDAEASALADELAELIGPMRATSRYAVRAFIEAMREGHLGVDLTIHGPRRRGGIANASLVISPDLDP